MGTIHNEAGLRFFFYSNEHAPAHVHVERDDGEAKIQLIGADGKPELISVEGLKRPDVRRAMEIVAEQQQAFIAEWIAVHG